MSEDAGSAVVPRYIAIEGVIGAGKTTLATMLAARLKRELVLERFEENPFLPLFYADPVRHAFATQIYFLLSRFRQQKELRRLLDGGESVVGDYMFDKDRIFATLMLEGEELELYDAVAAPLSQALPAPDLIIYLRSSVERATANIRKRGRPMEKGIGAEYLGRLADAYETFFGQKQTARIIVVDTARIDLLNDTGAFNELVGEIVGSTDTDLHSSQLTK